MNELNFMFDFFSLSKFNINYYNSNWKIDVENILINLTDCYDMPLANEKL
jgi:hypothetical protein